MMGDGQTKYDQAHDGDETNIAACSVCLSSFYSRFFVHERCVVNETERLVWAFNFVGKVSSYKRRH